MLIQETFFGKLGLEWEDEILNTRETSIVNKKVAYKNIFDFIVYYFLIVISFNCFYYCTKHWLKHEHVIWRMNNVKEIDIKNG